MQDCKSRRTLLLWYELLLVIDVHNKLRENFILHALKSKKHFVPCLQLHLSTKFLWFLGENLANGFLIFYLLLHPVANETNLSGSNAFSTFKPQNREAFDFHYQWKLDGSVWQRDSARTEWPVDGRPGWFQVCTQAWWKRNFLNLKLNHCTL